MLASITPLGERGRNSHWALTAVWFLLGSTLAATAVGASLGGAGELLLPRSLMWSTRLAALAVAVLVAAWLDLRDRPVPGPRRQVDERWLHRYRSWVYGLGYGAQLGAAVSTVVSSAATYAALLAAFLSGSALRGLFIVGCYGAVRGLTPLVGARVHTPDRLFALHAGLGRWRPTAERAARLGLVAACVCSLAGAAA